MTKKAPGKAHRQGLSLIEIAEMFGDEDNARTWIEDQRWPDGPHCPKCGSVKIKVGVPHPSMTHRCNDCKAMFTVKVGTVMEGSKLPYRAWAVGIYLFTTNLKGISSMKLHRELKIGQKAAWFMLARLRKAYEAEIGPFTGPIEVDETHIGGKRRNMPKAKRRTLEGRGPVGKTTVIGAKDRASNKVIAKTVETRDTETLHDFVGGVAAPGATVYTDDWRAYRGMPFHHEAVNHSAGEYVRGVAHTQGIEAHWSSFKRGFYGTYHKMSPKHLDRYVAEFAGRHNSRDMDTIDQMTGIVAGMEGKRLRYSELIADNGLDNGARS